MQDNKSKPKSHLSTAEVARMLRMSPRTLERHRRENCGLPYIKVDGYVWYRRSEIERYLAQATVYPSETWTSSVNGQKPRLKFLLTGAEVAQMLGLSIRTLRRHRQEKQGLPYVKVDREVWYRRDEVERYLARATVYPSKS